MLQYYKQTIRDLRNPESEKVREVYKVLLNRSDSAETFIDHVARHSRLGEAVIQAAMTEVAECLAERLAEVGSVALPGIGTISVAIRPREGRDKGLMDQFDYVLRRVHDSQPQARIILHAVMHANRYVSNSYDYYSVENLEKVNSGLRELAEAYDWVWFVDCNAPFCDEEGYLYDYMSMDGEHLLPDYSILWAEEIRRQAVTG